MNDTADTLYLVYSDFFVGYAVVATFLAGVRLISEKRDLSTVAPSEHRLLPSRCLPNERETVSVAEFG